MTTNAKVYRKLVVEKNLTRLRCFQLETVPRREWTFSNDPCKECRLYVDVAPPGDGGGRSDVSRLVDQTVTDTNIEEKNSGSALVKGSTDGDEAETPFERFSKEQATHWLATHPGGMTEEGEAAALKTHLQRAWLDLPDESKRKYLDEFDLRLYGKFMTERGATAGRGEHFS